MSETLREDQVLRIGAFVLDTRKGTLSNGASSVFLRPKAYGLLQHLARHAGRIVPKDELMAAVWPGLFVTEDSLTQAVREIRKALGDSAQEIIRTVSRRGYMLASQRQPEAAGIETQPVVAVIRFRDDSEPGGRQVVVNGFAEDVATGLAHYGSLAVLAPNSSFQFLTGGPVELSAVALRLGADFLVTGSVRWVGGSAWVSVGLVEADTQRQLWGERYEARDIEIFAVQREISAQIVNRLVSRLDEHSLRRSAVRPAATLAAYELVTCGVAMLRASGPGEVGDAVRLLVLAVEKDPDYGLAHAFLALARVVEAGYGQAPRPVLDTAMATATRSMALSPEQGVGPRVRSLVRLYLRQHAGAESDLRTALGLNPYDADSIEQMGYLAAMRGKPLEALSWIERAMRLNPIFPGFYHFDRGLAHYALGQYSEAVEAFGMPPRLPAWIEMRLAAAHAQLGNADAARRHVRRAHILNPSYDALLHTREQTPYEHADDVAHLAEGIELAQGHAR